MAFAEERLSSRAVANGDDYLSPLNIVEFQRMLPGSAPSFPHSHEEVFQTGSIPPLMQPRFLPFASLPGSAQECSEPSIRLEGIRMTDAAATRCPPTSITFFFPRTAYSRCFRPIFFFPGNGCFLDLLEVN